MMMSTNIIDAWHFVLNTSKTGQFTITVLQQNGVRLNTLGKNVEVNKDE